MLFLFLLIFSKFLHLFLVLLFNLCYQNTLYFHLHHCSYHPHKHTEINSGYLNHITTVYINSHHLLFVKSILSLSNGQTINPCNFPNPSLQLTIPQPPLLLLYFPLHPLFLYKISLFLFFSIQSNCTLSPYTLLLCYLNIA